MTALQATILFSAPVAALLIGLFIMRWTREEDHDATGQNNRAR